MSAQPDPPTEQPNGWRFSGALKDHLLKTVSDALEHPPQLTYAEFLDWADEDTLAEWVDGAIIMTSPASLEHQRIGAFVRTIFAEFVHWHHLGVVIAAPFQMKLDKSGREPDILFVAQDHLSRLKKTYLDGPADLVVEIISPESMGRDRGDKFFEYEKAGIPEYWLIDPLTSRVEFYQLDDAGHYQTVLPDQAGVYHAQVIPGFWLRVAWLWQDPHPDTTDILLEIGGDDYAAYLTERLRAHNAPS